MGTKISFDNHTFPADRQRRYDYWTPDDARRSGRGVALARSVTAANAHKPGRAKRPPSLVAVERLQITMTVFLIHVRDPQFYALPSRTRARNGKIRVMGFPPIGIMSLSAVLESAGHECVAFYQANAPTPNWGILEEIQRH